MYCVPQTLELEAGVLDTFLIGTLKVTAHMMCPQMVAQVEGHDGLIERQVDAGLLMRAAQTEVTEKLKGKPQKDMGHMK